MVWLDEPSRLGDRRHNVSDIVREGPEKLSKAIIQLFFEWIIKSLYFFVMSLKVKPLGQLTPSAFLGLWILPPPVLHEQLGSNIH